MKVSYSPTGASYNLSQTYVCAFFIAARNRVTRCVCEKVAQSVAQSIVCENDYVTAEKNITIICASSVISQKKPQANSHSIGENSPNLVTLPELNHPTNCSAIEFSLILVKLQMIYFVNWTAPQR
jgi:hypothetical protein